MKRMNLLLVDDEEGFVTTLAERLRMRDLDPNMAFDGDQALSFIEENEPDVIVLDLKMPGTDGMEVLRHVKKDYPNIEVVILTGHGTEKDRETAMELGAFDYLEKPVNLEKLIAQLEKAFKRKIG